MTLAHRVPVAKGLCRYEQLQLRKHKAQKFESVRPELLIGLAPGTMKAIAIKIITVVAFYQIVWYHAHMQISPSYAVKRILALVPRSRVLGWLSQNLGRPWQDAGTLRRSIGGTRFLSE
jgi:hypothetical protein